MTFEQMLAKIDEHQSVIETFKADLKTLGTRHPFWRASGVIVDALHDSKNIFIAGCGGSAADSQHFAAELTGRFESQKRKPLPCVALTTDTSALTAIGNDYSFDRIFARQVEALGRPGDVLIVISTSGKTPAVLNAIVSARILAMEVVALTGENGLVEMRHGVNGAASGITTVKVPSKNTARIQECHILMLHMIAQAIDGAF